jgi:hypothetical protein
VSSGSVPEWSGSPPTGIIMIPLHPGAAIWPTCSFEISTLAS